MVTFRWFGRCWGFEAALQGSIPKTEKTLITYFKVWGGVILEITWEALKPLQFLLVHPLLINSCSIKLGQVT